MDGKFDDISEFGQWIIEKEKKHKERKKIYCATIYSAFIKSTGISADQRIALISRLV